MVFLKMGIDSVKTVPNNHYFHYGTTMLLVGYSSAESIFSSGCNAK